MIGMSDTTIAGTSIGGGNCGSFSPNVAFWVTPRQGEDAGHVSSSPVISSEGLYAMDTRTWGDYVASYVFRDPKALVGEHTRTKQARLILARISDWSMRRIDPLPDHDILTFALSSSYLYVVYTPVVPFANYGQFTHVYRYDLRQFDAVGIPHVPGSGLQ